MRDGVGIIAACAGLIACTRWTPPLAIFCRPPQPLAARPGTPLEPGRPCVSMGQQAAVTTGVLKWMKDPVGTVWRNRSCSK